MRQVSWYRQLGLALSLFILGTLAYWLEYKHRPEQETMDEQAKKPFNIATSVEKVFLVGRTSSTDETPIQVSFHCGDFAKGQCKPGDHSNWEISEPKPLRADTGNVNALLNAANSLTPTEVIDLKDETPEKRAALLKDYGLDPESLKTDRRLEITTAEGKTTLYLGTVHPIGESIFAFSDTKGKENKVFLIPSFMKGQFEHDLTFWRDKKLFSLAAYEIASLDLLTPKARVTAARDHGRWVVHSGSETYEGEVESIDQLLGATVGLSAKEFVAEDQGEVKAKTLMKRLTKVLTLSLVKEESKKPAPTESAAPDSAIDSGAEEPSGLPPTILTLYQEKNFDAKGKTAAPIYATVSGLKSFFELDFGVFNRLNKSVRDLRMNRLITPVDKFATQHLTFTGAPIGDTPLVLNKKEEKWQFGDGSENSAGVGSSESKNEIAAEKVQALLDQLSSSKNKDFLTGKSIPAGENLGVQIALADDKNEVRRKYVFWVRDGKLYARDLLVDRKEVVWVEPAVQKVFPWDKNFFKKSEPPKVAPAAAPVPDMDPDPIKNE